MQPAGSRRYRDGRARAGVLRWSIRFMRKCGPRRQHTGPTCTGTNLENGMGLIIKAIVNWMSAAAAKLAASPVARPALIRDNRQINGPCPARPLSASWHRSLAKWTHSLAYTAVGQCHADVTTLAAEPGLCSEVAIPDDGSRSACAAPGPREIEVLPPIVTRIRRTGKTSPAFAFVPLKVLYIKKRQ